MSALANNNTAERRTFGSHIEGVSWCAVFSIEALVILISNSMTLAVFLNTTRLRKQTSILLINLALADLLVGVVAVPGWVYFLGSMFDLWKNEFSVAVNIVYTVIDISAAFASVTNHGCIAVERLIATFMPFTHRAIKRQLNWLFVAVVWVLALIIPALTNVGWYVLHSQMFAFYVWMPFLSVLLLVISVSYWFLLRKVNSIGRDLRKDSDRSHRFTITAFIVTIVSLTTWLPFMIMSTVNLVQPVNQDLRLVNPVKLLHFANSLSSPFIYWFRIPNFKQSFYTVACRRKPEHAHDRVLARQARSRSTEPPPDHGIDTKL